MTKKRELRIRVDEAIIAKLKEVKKELDAPSYKSVLRTLLGVKQKPWFSKEAILKVVKKHD